METSLPTRGIEIARVNVEGGGMTFSAKDWEGIIKHNYKEFKGNSERAGILMAEFCQGVKETFALHARGRYKDLSIPQVAFLPSATGNDPDFALQHLVNGDVFGVNLSSLETDSLRPREKLISARSGDDINFHGFIEDIWRAGGWEEGHHALFRGGGSISESADQELPSVAYDAVPIELKALRWQVHMARKLHAQDSTRFPWYTQRVMEARYHRASQYKKTKQQLPPLTLDSLGISFDSK
ncbi:MAG TPA: hypothetical protein VF189_01920 [Patescibacteria group bacterium]